MLYITHSKSLQHDQCNSGHIFAQATNKHSVGTKNQNMNASIQQYCVKNSMRLIFLDREKPVPQSSLFHFNQVPALILLNICHLFLFPSFGFLIEFTFLRMVRWLFIGNGRPGCFHKCPCICVRIRIRLAPLSVGWLVSCVFLSTIVHPSPVDPPPPCPSLDCHCHCFKCPTSLLWQLQLVLTRGSG